MMTYEQLRGILTEPWQQRIIDEFEEVEDRLALLVSFLHDKTKIENLSDDEIEMLWIQKDAMYNYHQALYDRIDFYVKRNLKA